VGASGWNASGAGLDMATLRQLPSGNWQASVLLDDGSRTTTTRAEADEAMAWAVRTEEERDARRAERAAQSQKERIDLVLAELGSLAAAGSLSPPQRRRLRKIAEGL
jgi:hypothetical protein